MNFWQRLNVLKNAPDCEWFCICDLAALAERVAVEPNENNKDFDSRTAPLLATVA
jgi:hypothetical protein